MPRGWGGPWGPMPWGGVVIPPINAVDVIIDTLAAVSNVTKYVGSGSSARIYGAYPQTIQDAVLPAISVALDVSEGQQVDNAYLDFLVVEIGIWMRATGKNANVWDDVMECHGAIMDALHRTKVLPTTHGLTFIMMTNLDEGPQIASHEGVMFYPSKWRAIIK